MSPPSSTTVAPAYVFTAVDAKRRIPAPRFTRVPAVPGTLEIGIVVTASEVISNVAPFAPICTVAPVSPQMNQLPLGV